MRTTGFVFLYAMVIIAIAAFMQKKPKHVQELSPLVMGIFPRFEHDATIDNFSPLAKYLSQKLGRRVHLVSAQSFDDFWSQLHAREFDLVHYNQYHYISTNKTLNYEVIAMNEERGRSTISAAIAVRKDSGIQSIRDLRGKTILFGGGPKAMQSYIYARFILEQGGLKNGDYFVRFESSPPSALIATYYNLWDAKAAGVGDVVLELPGVKKLFDTNQLTYLTVGEQYAQLPWAVKKELDPALKEKIQQVLIQLKNEPAAEKVLKKAQVTGFVRATDADYNPHRQITMATLGETY